MAEGGRLKTLYEKLEDLPEGLNGEIIDGQLYTEPRPKPRSFGSRICGRERLEQHQADLRERHQQQRHGERDQDER
jgi:hypothetical protein